MHFAVMTEKNRRMADAPPTSTTPDIEPPLPEDNKDLQEIENEITTVEQEAVGLEQFVQFTESYLANGDDVALTAFGIKMGYLNGTAMQVYGLESINPESITYAQESLMTAVKDKVGKWIANIGPTLLATGKAIWGFVSRQISKITQLAGNAAKGIKNTVKAHPFATVAATVATCVGLGAIAPAMLRSAPALMGTVGRMGMSEAGTTAAKAATGAAAKTAAKTAASAAAKTATKTGSIAAQAAGTASKLNTIVSAIKWPFGAFKVVMNGAGTGFKLVKTAAKAVVPTRAAASALGWTSSAVTGLVGKLIGGLRTVIPNLTDLAVKQYQSEVALIKSHWAGGNYFKLAGNIGMNAMAIMPFFGIIWSVIKALFALVKEIVWGTCRIVIHTLQAITGHGDSDNTPAPAEA